MAFKRPKERKKLQNELNVPYQPFSKPESEIPSKMQTSDSPIEKDETNRIQNLYQQFASERDREERGIDKKIAPEVSREKPRTGNTIYVSGKTVTEDFLKKNFSEFGTIVNVSMEIEKHRGFITFSKPEVSEQAISEVSIFLNSQLNN